MSGEPVKPKSPALLLAEAIADDLFADVRGVPADRLVCVDKENRPGGGWCRGAVVDRILAILAAPRLEQMKPKRKGAAKR